MAVSTSNDEQHKLSDSHMDGERALLQTSLVHDTMISVKCKHASCVRAWPMCSMFAWLQSLRARSLPCFYASCTSCHL